MTNPNDDDLVALFAQARSADTSPSDDLMARILGDADAVQDGFTPVQTSENPGLWARMMDALGGWPSLSGLAAATVAGIWVGVAPPSAIEELTATVLGDEVNISLFSTDIGFDTGVLIDG